MILVNGEAEDELTNQNQIKMGLKSSYWPTRLPGQFQDFCRGAATPGGRRRNDSIRPPISIHPRGD